ncbi:MAG: SMP-30/gluconolactonase/LRE family protein [Planctomycetales bacterium]
MSRTVTLSVSIAFLFLTSVPLFAEKPMTPEKFGNILRLDPRLDKLVPPNAQMEKLAEGFEWSEGPVWIKDGGYLLFSDIPRNSIMKWQEGKGISVFMKPSGYTGVTDYGLEPGCNGLLLDPQGQLVACEHGDRRVSVLTKEGGKRTLVDNFMGKRLNSPNDGVFKSNGDLYFTDPPYGLPKGADDPRRELDFCGVYRLSAQPITIDKEQGTATTSASTRAITLLTKIMTRPNGIGFSPDEKTLYVAQSDPAAPIWRAFEVLEDGTLGKDRVFYDSTNEQKKYKKGLPDGLKVDASGNIFATGPGGVLVFDPDGTLLGVFETGEATANCGWGDDGSTLYICADMYIVRIRLTTKGKGW